MSLRSDYDSVFRSLSRVELQRGAGDLELPDLFGTSTDPLWLGFYSEEGLRIALARYGFFESLADAGYAEVRLEIQCDDPEEHLLRIWSQRPELPEAPLIELVARRDVLIPQAELKSRLGRPWIGVLNIQWLQLQRPDAVFTPDRLPFPGQQFPGLGLGREVMELLRQAAKRLHLEALVTVPSYFHNAWLYSEEFRYLDPREQGVFRALCRDVVPLAFGSACAASWAVVEQMVVRDGKPFQWFHDVMVAPLSADLTHYLDAQTYNDEAAAAEAAKFDVFEAALSRHLATRGIIPFDLERITEWIGDRV